MSTKDASRLPLRWSALFQSAGIVGVLLMIIPQGIPWSHISFSLGSVMGRTFGVPGMGATLGRIALHLILSGLYALILVRWIRKGGSWGALLMGGFGGLILYFLNLVFMRLVCPECLGDEVRVVVVHVVYGFLLAAAYRGITTRPRRLSPSHPIAPSNSNE